MKTILGFLFAALVACASESVSAPDLSRRANELYKQARYAEAEPLFRRALDEWDKLGPEAALGRAQAMRSLGSLLRARGRYAEAEPLLSGAALQLEAAGASALEIARTWYNLAALHRTRGNLAKAESCALRSIEFSEKPPGIAGPERHGARLVLSSIYIEQRRFDEAETILNSPFEDADGPLAVVIYNNRATVAIARGTYEPAESLARQALQMARLSLAPDHPGVAAAWSNLAQACRFQSKYLEAEDAYRRAIGIWETSLGADHPEVAMGLMNLAAFYHERGRETGSERLYKRAADILEHAFGRDDVRVLTVRNELADVLRGERRYTESAKLVRSTLTSLEKLLAADDPRLARAQSNYARLLQETSAAVPPCRTVSDCEL